MANTPDTDKAAAVDNLIFDRLETAGCKTKLDRIKDLQGSKMDAAPSWAEKDERPTFPCRICHPAWNQSLSSEPVPELRERRYQATVIQRILLHCGRSRCDQNYATTPASGPRHARIPRLYHLSHLVRYGFRPFPSRGGAETRQNTA